MAALAGICPCSSVGNPGSLPDNEEKKTLVIGLSKDWIYKSSPLSSRFCLGADYVSIGGLGLAGPG